MQGLRCLGWVFGVVKTLPNVDLKKTMILFHDIAHSIRSGMMSLSGCNKELRFGMRCCVSGK